MGSMKTPGVYIVEKNAFPNSVVQVATAVPAFIGYTEQAKNGNKSLSGRAQRVTSLAEFTLYFGGAPTPLFSIQPAAAGGEGDLQIGKQSFVLEQTAGRFNLYYSMRLFFQNGGGACYIVSVGSYADTIDKDTLLGGLLPLVKEQEPTMVVIPETTLLSNEADSISVQQAALMHCKVTMGNRIALLDLWGGQRSRQSEVGDPVDSFRNQLGINSLDFGVAYYPFLHTTIVSDRELSFANFAKATQLQPLIAEDLGIQLEATADTSPTEQRLMDIVAKLARAEADEPWPADEAAELDKSLRSLSKLYAALLRECQAKLNLLPPGPAMAGIYTLVDSTQGVWKAPANVSLNSVTAPAVELSHDEQEDLNVHPAGKSINAIRTFINEGVLVWGARTLDGNNLDFRYVSVRRTMIMLEESVKLAAKAFVFASNDANTWVTLRSMVRNFLHGIWKQGGLAGSSPEDAFSVHVGLGETMTAEDILEGILRVTVLVAITRPAEFIEITFQQQLQKS